MVVWLSDHIAVLRGQALIREEVCMQEVLVTLLVPLIVTFSVVMLILQYGFKTAIKQISVMTSLVFVLLSCTKLGSQKNKMTLRCWQSCGRIPTTRKNFHYRTQQLQKFISLFQ